MDKQKRLNYQLEMTINGIHTITGYLPGEIKSLPVRECVKYIDDGRDCDWEYGYQPQNNRSFILIDCNKYEKVEGGMITKFSDFQRTLKLILKQLGGYRISDFDVERVDFAFNSCNTNSFEEYGKLHRLLLHCITMSQKTDKPEGYATRDGITFEPISFVTKNDYFEVENYYKYREEDEGQTYYNRLEIRSIRMNGSDIKNQFLGDWNGRLESVKNYLLEAQRNANSNLVAMYRRDQEQGEKCRKFMTLSQFFLVNQDVIFTRKQLIDLCRQLGFEGAEDKADKWRDLHKPDFLLKADVDFAAKVLKDKLNDYFNS